MNKVLQFSLLLILVGCNQDSPNVKQIGNMQYFIENAAQDGINQVESGLQYSIISSGDETCLLYTSPSPRD